MFTETETLHPTVNYPIIQWGATKLVTILVPIIIVKESLKTFLQYLLFFNIKN